jgi:hypothetical protein
MPGKALVAESPCAVFEPGCRPLCGFGVVCVFFLLVVNSFIKACSRLCCCRGVALSTCCGAVPPGDCERGSSTLMPMWLTDPSIEMRVFSIFSCEVLAALSLGRCRLANVSTWSARLGTPGPCVLEIFPGYASPCLMDLLTPKICCRRLNMYRSYCTLHLLQHTLSLLLL